MSEPKKTAGSATDNLKHYYDRVNEQGRLGVGPGLLELARTQDILTRHLPTPPADIGDVGGGAGVHAFWLAKRGYRVHLVDPVPKHIEQANRASSSQPDFPLASVTVGDARFLEWEDDLMDALLFLGPLYHLTDRKDRIKSLREASRVTREGGLIFAACISRFASLLDGIFLGFLDDPSFVSIVHQDLLDGQHRNPTDNPAYFTSTFFHHPDDIHSEVEESGLGLEKILAVESIGGLLPDIEGVWKDSEKRKRLMRFIQKIEEEPSLLGASAHIIAILKNTPRQGREE
jgi:ubiquinone/menaquinone biosynthesis C-methylase UbiE